MAGPFIVLWLFGFAICGRSVAGHVAYWGAMQDHKTTPDIEDWCMGTLLAFFSWPVFLIFWTAMAILKKAGVKPFIVGAEKRYYERQRSGR